MPKRARPYDGVAGRQRRGRRAWTKKPAANAYAYKGDWPERRVSQQRNSLSDPLSPYSAGLFARLDRARQVVGRLSLQG